MTADESAAVALAFAALRARGTVKTKGARSHRRWAARKGADLEAFGPSRVRHNGFSAWTATARLEALRHDV